MSLKISPDVQRFPLHNDVSFFRDRWHCSHHTCNGIIWKTSHGVVFYLWSWKKFFNLLLELKISCSLQAGKYCDLHFWSFLRNSKDSLPKKGKTMRMFSFGTVSMILVGMKILSKNIWCNFLSNFLETYSSEKFVSEMLLLCGICSKYSRE